jgi:hypothetical protein
MDKELAFLEQHLNAFMVALRGELASNQETEQGERDALDETDAAWRLYRAQVCKLSFNYFAGGQGTFAVPERGMCELRLDRTYVLQLSPLILPHRVVK